MVGQLEYSLMPWRIVGSWSTSTPLNLTPRCVSTWTTAAENPHCGKTGVPFMKGTPVFPQCGFSAAVVQVLTHLGVKFKGVDVLQDPTIRQGIKEYSNWPTIPQLY